MPSKPALDRRGLLRAIVVHDEMHDKRGGDVLFHMLQELEKLPGAMAPVQLPDDLADGDVERGKKGGGAMAHVIVGRSGSPGIVDEQRITRELEGFLSVRLQTEGAPDAHHRALRYAHRIRHRARVPVRAVARLLMQGFGDQSFHLRIADLARGAWPRLIKQAIEPALEEALAPLAYRLWRHPRAARNLATGQTLGRRKHDARTRRQRPRCAAAPRPLGELMVLLHRQRYLFKLRSATHSSLPDVHYGLEERSTH